ncbi:MetQ/NlpA family ABC transporter substrate-binding protein [Methylobacterium sp. E-016]|uniref:MetQ/NlpA family ABC transporter substrate-binding protein n=1 Tax=Methylobacterium sp. E-016 TaxID=2836556 RepID=UPI0028BD4059|nr:MetQ/NlpA family ABC transporter substrate-binding protein [Methylobacterium sp. E-016]
MHVEPLGIYSLRFRTHADVPAGSSVALSNNGANSSRGLRLLQDQGLIRLRSSGDGTFATVNDIADNPKRLKFVEVAPPQLPRTLDDVALSVINGNYALKAGLTPAKDALGLVRAEGNP